MSACAVICEYNPMHLGHVRHLAESRRQTGCDRIILVMSGSVVQRGEFAFLDKFTRARIALENGADLVLELPSAFACAAADDFALYAVRMLNALPCVTHLSFGSGCGDIEKLLHAREILDREEFRGELVQELGGGRAYAEAFRTAAKARLAGEDLDGLLSDSNDLLALSYLKALHATDSQIRPVAIPRKGSYNAPEIPEDPLCISASAVRRYADAHSDLFALSRFLPAGTLDALRKRAPLSAPSYYAMLRIKLLGSSDEELRAIEGMDEGLENRLRTKCGAPDFAGFLREVSTRRYSPSRIRRTLLRLLLGIRRDFVRDAKSASPLLRVLGLKKGAEDLLSDAGRTLFISPAAASSLPQPLQKLAEIDALASDLRALLTDPREFRREFTTGLVKV